MNNKIIYSNNFNFSKKFFWFNQNIFLLLFLFYISTLYTSKEFSDQISQRKFLLLFLFYTLHQSNMVKIDLYMILHNPTSLSHIGIYNETHR